MDFLSISLGKYIQMNLEFAKKLSNPPLIFSVNYFLRDEKGMFLNAIQDKRIWLKWIRQRADNKVKALITPTGLIPQYDDLAALFKSVLDKEYNKEDYIKQFSLRIPENLAKLERIENIYKELKYIPDCLFKELEDQRARLKSCQKDFGDYVSPTSFKAE